MYSSEKGRDQHGEIDLLSTNRPAQLRPQILFFFPHFNPLVAVFFQLTCPTLFVPNYLHTEIYLNRFRG